MAACPQSLLHLDCELPVQDVCLAEIGGDEKMEEQDYLS
jgi:hypothetical protein